MPGMENMVGFPLQIATNRSDRLGSSETFWKAYKLSHTQWQLQNECLPLFFFIAFGQFANSLFL
jgi:hypothetical protein